MWRSIPVEDDNHLSAPQAAEPGESATSPEAQSRHGKRSPPGFSLVTLLLLFGASLVVPAVAATGLLLERQARLQSEQVERRVEQVAGDLADGIDRELELLAATLTVMAASPDLAAGRLAAFHAWASRIVRPLDLHVLYRDLDGQQQLNTRVAFGTPLPREMLPEIDAAVLETRKPYVSDMLVGAVRGNFVVTVTAPVVVDGKVNGFLHFSIDPERLLGVMQGQQLPADWNTGISDRNGIVIARLRRHADFVGSPLPLHLRAGSGTENASFLSTNMEGVATLRATKASAMSGWLVSANVPQSVARAAFVETLWSVLGAAFVLFLLALGLALVLGRMIARPIRQIAGFAALVENERIPPPLQSPVREANEVAAGLRRASERLSERTRELRETLARFNAALRGADIVVFVQGRDRRITWISESAGYRARYFVGKREEDLVDGPEELASAIALREQVFATGQPQEGELTTGSGEASRHYRQRLEPIRDADGTVAGILGVSVEVTTLRREQDRNSMLVRELAHRSKNLLSVVQAVADETLRSGGADSFMDRFRVRIQSLARLQDLVISGARGGVELGQLVRSQLAPFAERGPRLAITGPPLRLRPEAANILGMALNELATNAAKYGCLSVPEGTVDIGWVLVPDTDGAQRFRLTWREGGGPPVSRPAYNGFGSRVIVDMTAATLSGTVDLDYQADGIVWRVDAPANIVME